MFASKNTPARRAEGLHIGGAKHKGTFSPRDTGEEHSVHTLLRKIICCGHDPDCVLKICLRVAYIVNDNS